MTASHIQVLRAGPVQPIGLPPTATTTMGVTNARVLHRRMLNNSGGQAIRNNNTLSLLGAKRCLFGSPEPGEIQAIYQEEMKRNRERFLERYGYDILNDKFVDGESNNNNNNNEDDGNHKTESVHPVLQDTTVNDKCNNKTNQELVEERLHEGLYSGSESSSSMSSSLSRSCESDNCDNECNLNKIQLLTITNNNNNNKDNNTTNSSTITTVPSIVKLIPPPGSSSSPNFKDRKNCERLKPYSRQNLITEYYNTRKTVSLTTISTTHAIEVSQLPKPQKAKIHNHQQQQQQQQQQQHHQQYEDV